MKRAMRLTLLAAVAGTALTIAGSASPAPAAVTAATKLNIRTQPGLGATGPVTIGLHTVQADDPLAKVAIYTGLGYTANLTQATGTTLGAVSATVFLASLNAPIPLAGSVQARAADGTYLSATTGKQTPLTEAATQCTGIATHTAFWVLVLTAAGQTVEVPVFVDAAAGMETAFAAYKIQVCFSRPDQAPGIRPLDAKLALTNVFTNPASGGTPVWSAFFTPYVPGTGTPNPAGTVEARSATVVPASITLKAKYDRKRKAAVLGGVISIASRPLAGISVPIYKGATPGKVTASAGRTSKSTSKGIFAAVKKIAKTTYFRVGGILGGGDVTAQLCAGTSLAPGGCVSGTVGEIPLFSKIVKVVVPKRK
jgi:hypothetical protein